METRVILGVVFGAIVVAAASGQERAPRAAPAEALYQLALAEWQAHREQGLVLPTDPSGTHAQVLGAVNRVFVQPAPDDGQSDAWQEIAPLTQQARHLLAQAAAAPIGHLTLGRAADAPQIAVQLEELALATARIAALDLEHGQTATWTTLTLLRHARHLLTSESPSFVASGHAVARHATELLRADLDKVPADKAHARLRERCLEEVDQLLSRDIDPTAARKEILAGIAPRLEAHRPRLRDMHQTSPAGYDDARMQEAIERELTLLLDACDERCKRSGRPWPVELDDLAEDPARRAPADVTTMAARGIVDLILCGFRIRSQADAAYREALIACRDRLVARD